MSSKAKRARQRERREERESREERIAYSREQSRRVLELMGRDRCYDLVRQQRGPLLDAGLITAREYAALVYSGSQGSRALETYDVLIADRSDMAALLHAALEAMASSVEFDVLGGPTALFSPYKWNELKPKIEAFLERKGL